MCGSGVAVDLGSREREGSMGIRCFTRPSAEGARLAPADCAGRGCPSLSGSTVSLVVAFDLRRPRSILRGHCGLQSIGDNNRNSRRSRNRVLEARVPGRVVEGEDQFAIRRGVRPPLRREAIPSTRRCPLQRRRGFGRSPDGSVIRGAVHHAASTSPLE